MVFSTFYQAIRVPRVSSIQAPENPRLTGIELCAGAGGQAIGLHRAGFDHAALVEIDPHAAETLRINGSDRGWWTSDSIHQMSLTDWRPQRDVRVDLLSGGVPCPPFSIAGRQLGAADERDLFPSVLNLVGVVRPSAVMIENVPGLLGKKFEEYRADILGVLEGCHGYRGEWKLLEAHKFGVPQLRPRAVLVVARPSVWRHFTWPTAGVAPTPTVGETLYPMMASKGWIGAARWRDQAAEISPTIVGGSRKHGGADLGPTRAKRHWLEKLGVNGAVLADEPPAADYKGIPKLTVEMAAAVQGFPADWIFTGGKTARYRQVGNAFPPPVAEAVGRQIAHAIHASRL